MKRDKYPTRTYLLTDISIADFATAAIQNAPIDSKNPIEVVIRERVKARKKDQNALMWAGPLKDIAEQAYIDGRTFSAAVWHEHFKREFLPEDCEVSTEHLLKNPETYEKWSVTPRGDRVLVGSTTDLSIKGFAQYMEQIYSYGASLGVQFRTNREQ